MTETEYRAGPALDSPPGAIAVRSDLEAHIRAAAIAVARLETRARTATGAMTPDRLDGCRLAAIDLATRAAALCRAVEAALLASSGPLGMPDHREPGEEP